MASSTNGTTYTTDDEDPPSKRRPTPRNALPCNTDQIAHVELFRPKTITNSSSSNSSSSNNSNAASNNGSGKKKKKKRRPPLKKYHLLFAMLYLHQAYWIYSTVGVPYKEFLDKAEREGFEGELYIVVTYNQKHNDLFLKK